MHRNAPLTPEGRLRLCQRIEAGWTVAAAAESMNISRQCAHKWWRRYRDEGVAGLGIARAARVVSAPDPGSGRAPDRGVAPVPPAGPGPPAGIVGVPASTVHRVLVRHGVNRLRWMDRPTGRVIRRIETSRCGELVHIDVKKLARVPDGGGHKMHGRAGHATVAREAGSATPTSTPPSTPTPGSPTASSPAPRTPTNCVAFLDRAVAWFAAQGITIERILTDNGNGYRSHAWRDRCAELGIIHTRTRPYHPATNGKVERFNRTLLDEWAYARPWTLRRQPSPRP